MKTSLKLLFACLLISHIVSGCAHSPLYFPTFSSSKAQCDPVWIMHVPASTANIHEVGIILRNNPSLLDKGLPSPTMLDALGKNGIPIGLGAASIVSAINGNPLSAVIGSAVTSGISSLTALRSEDKFQDRQEVCLPRDAKSMVMITEDAKIFISKDPVASLAWAKDVELKPEDHHATERPI